MNDTPTKKQEASNLETDPAAANSQESLIEHDETDYDALRAVYYRRRRLKIIFGILTVVALTYALR